MAIVISPSCRKLGESWSTNETIEVQPWYGGSKNGFDALGRDGPLQVTGEIVSSAFKLIAGVGVAVGVGVTVDLA